jgi:hypothetical protein
VYRWRWRRSTQSWFYTLSWRCIMTFDQFVENVKKLMDTDYLSVHEIEELKKIYDDREKYYKMFDDYKKSMN